MSKENLLLIQFYFLDATFSLTYNVSTNIIPDSINAYNRN